MFFVVNIIIISHYFVSLYYKNNNDGSSRIGQKRVLALLKKRIINVVNVINKSEISY